MTEQTSHRALADRSPSELRDFLIEQQAAYAVLKGMDLKLDLTRGKPSSAQLDLSNALLTLPTSVKDSAGVDTRNYGGLDGIASIRAMFAELLGVQNDQIVAGGSSSLAMMRDVLLFLWLKGGIDSARPWAAEESVKFLCPVPGYDRHFTLTDWIGIEMIPVPLNEDGPDMDVVEELVAADPSIKGMWLVPTYANPTGSVTSTADAQRLASMKTAAPDFTILWDNAYALHHLTDDEVASADIIALCADAGNPHRAIMFASTSKITWAGAGVAFLAASTDVIGWYTGHLGKGQIGPDKVNQLRHVEFFGHADGVRAHMRKHRALIAPKFTEVERILSERLDGLGVAEWTNPKGGYFISLDVVDGTASRVVELAKEAGIALTPAGSSFPLGKDPRNRNIRLAPTFPGIDEVTPAMEGVATCVLLAAAEKLAGN
ncbi:MAG TPA: aminotransferase class I/II-fold pyridoxal phosphate-dependent enzyme [Marmoricola sp.]|nr:aminotransferase class I/II-fold pyridoxal phosphate-dependent enzyme [Marmoricola sp.]